MLGIFQKLVASRVHDQDGFRVLEALLDSCPPDTLQPYMPQVCPTPVLVWLVAPQSIPPISMRIHFTPLQL